jgi:hypothetical protein
VARRQQLIEASPDRVWNVLADPRAYARWVVGTRRIEEADDTWPQVGAKLRYVVALGPVTFRDETVVRHCRPGERLELEAMASPIGSARIGIELMPWGGDTIVIVDEYPLRGIAARLHGAPGELLLHLRNRKMLRNLKQLTVDGEVDGDGDDNRDRGGDGGRDADRDEAPGGSRARKADGPGAGPGGSGDRG